MLPADIVISMSDFQRFKRCRKSFELTHFRGLEPRSDKEAMAQGREFHAYLEGFALSRCLDAEKQPHELITSYDTLQKRLTNLRYELQKAQEDSNMREVATQYIARQWDIEASRIIGIEEPLYTPLYDAYAGATRVWLRTTFDLIYRDTDGWIVGRDYKTFAAQVQHDVDLDFQGRIESMVLRKRFETDKARFEYCNVRRTPPEVVKDKAGNKWTERECYENIELYPSEQELEALWAETRCVAGEILSCALNGLAHPSWYRVDLKGTSPYTCGSCLVKDLCKAEILQGGLSQETIDSFATPREKAVVVLPNGHSVTTEAPRNYTYKKAAA